MLAEHDGLLKSTINLTVYSGFNTPEYKLIAWCQLTSSPHILENTNKFASPVDPNEMN